MALKKFLMIGIVAALLVACGGTRNSETGPSSVTPQNVTLSEVEGSSDSDNSAGSSTGFSDSKPSSSPVESSSSVAYVHPSTVVKGTMTDSRDGKVYRTVKIGDQVWMAENLNFDPGRGGSGDAKYDWSWCYGDEPKNCDVAGRLYTWAAAMDSVKLANDADNPQDCGYGKECDLASRPATLVQGICDKGWHLPSRVEWNALFAAVGDESTAGKILKSQTGWYHNGSGTDGVGFSALPAGRRGSDVSYGEEGYSVYFWSSTEISSNYAYRVYLEYDADDATLSFFYKYYGFSVRCVKN